MARRKSKSYQLVKILPIWSKAKILTAQDSEFHKNSELFF